MRIFIDNAPERPVLTMFPMTESCLFVGNGAELFKPIKPDSARGATSPGSKGEQASMSDAS
jgi:hypothetical protein